MQAAIVATQSQLPLGMPSPPSYKKVNPADQPVLYLSLGSTQMPISKVDEYAEDYLGERISMVSGVAQVQIYGAAKYAVRVQVDPKELASRGIGIDEVAQAVEAGNVDLPTGILYGQHQQFTVQAQGQLVNAAAYRPLIVTYQQWFAGAALRCRPGDRQRRERQDRGMDRWRAVGGSCNSAPARRQYRRSRR